MSLTYSTYQSALATLMATSTTDPNFTEILPSCIDYSEMRIYRELDFLNTVTTNTSLSFTANNRTLTLPANPYFIVLQEVNVITPAGSTPDSGTRNPLIPIAKEALDLLYPSSSGATVPEHFAMRDNQTILVGPWPDQGYTVELVGTQRPAPLSATNTTTYLATYLPDLFLAASMIFMSGYMRNFGSQADDPRMAQSWETQYQTLKQSAEVEEARKKFASQGWFSRQPSPVATPAQV